MASPGPDSPGSLYAERMRERIVARSMRIPMELLEEHVESGLQRPILPEYATTLRQSLRTYRKRRTRDLECRPPHAPND